MRDEGHRESFIMSDWTHWTHRRDITQSFEHITSRRWITPLLASPFGRM